jgi:hypothetical protein
VLPRVPAFDFSSSDYGANTQLFHLELSGGSLGRSSFETWADVRERAGIDELENGKSYALVVVGPTPGLRAEDHWNAPAIALVPTDPPVPEAGQ